MTTIAAETIADTIAATPAPLSARRALHAVLATPADGAAAIARIALGAVMFPHGGQHAFGWFGGYGYGGTMGWFTSLGIPRPFGFLAIATEVLGSIALLLGLGGRLAALAVAAVLAVAVAETHLQFGFFMNWVGQLHGEGFEYHILAIALAV